MNQALSSVIVSKGVRSTGRDPVSAAGRGPVSAAGRGPVSAKEGGEVVVSASGKRLSKIQTPPAHCSAPRETRTPHHLGWTWL